ncbi:MAG: sulfatase, partial [Planctomycetales bacterium]|nr:sulfatase [Planctomycetales bacterium]
LPYLSGENKEAPHKALYWRFGTQMAIRQGDWKLVRARTAPGKGQQNSPVDLGLYNLAADIGEQKNLAAEQPEKVKELQAAWDEWDKSNVAASWVREEIRKPAAGGKKPGAAGAKPGEKKKRAAAK